jgi:hypothetical protein
MISCELSFKMGANEQTNLIKIGEVCQGSWELTENYGYNEISIALSIKNCLILSSDGAGTRYSTGSE